MRNPIFSPLDISKEIGFEYGFSVNRHFLDVCVFRLEVMCDNPRLCDGELYLRKAWWKDEID